MVCHVARSKVKVKVKRRWKLEIIPFSKSISSAIFNWSWQMTADSLHRGHYLNLILPDCDVYPSFCVTWLWTWKNLARRRSRPSFLHGAIFLFIAQSLLQSAVCYNNNSVCPSVRYSCTVYHEWWQVTFALLQLIRHVTFGCVYICIVLQQ